MSLLHLLALAVPFQEGAPPADAPESGAGPSMLVPMLLIGLIFWFVLIAPERKQRKRREAVLGSLEKGDKVMTTSGIYAVIVQVQDDVVTLQVADGVRMRFSRQAIQEVLDDGAGEKAGAAAEKGEKAETKGAHKAK